MEPRKPACLSSKRAVAPPRSYKPKVTFCFCGLHFAFSCCFLLSRFRQFSKLNVRIGRVQKFHLSTSARNELVNITAEVKKAVQESGVKRGLCLVHAPHTTAAITVQEGYDPDVVRDILQSLDEQVPHANGYAHAEGNSAAHIKALMTGSSQTLPIEYSTLQLGRWQAVFFCEFDGPRERTVWIQIIKDET